MNLSLISKNLRKYPVLVVSGVVIPVSLVLLMMRGPKIDEYQGQLQELEKEWGDIQLNLERSKGLDANLESLRSGQAAIDSRLLKVEEVASNYEFFYGLERESGITVERFSIGLPSDGSKLYLGKDKFRHFSVVPCDVVMNGSIQEVLAFLDLLDRQKFIVRMDVLDTFHDQETADAEVIKARLRCHVLAAKDD